jgi:hypothetical protein
MRRSETTCRRDIIAKKKRPSRRPTLIVRVEEILLTATPGTGLTSPTFIAVTWSCRDHPTGGPAQEARPEGRAFQKKSPGQGV